MIKIDLHTHSNASPDGGLTPDKYRKMLASGALDVIAITDHNVISAAVEIHRLLGENIIVGEEILTSEGDLIGLYLLEPIPAGLSAVETAKRIHEQGGIVYVPHPFEKVRKGLGKQMLAALEGQIDIVETYNGRSVVQRGNRVASRWVKTNNIPAAASSDTHGWLGWGKTYTVLAQLPTKETLCQILQHESTYTVCSGRRGILYPKVNRLRKRLQSKPDAKQAHRP